MNQAEVQAHLQRIIRARHHDPFAVLGRHEAGGRLVVRAYLPSAIEVALAENNQAMQRLAGTDLFEWEGEAGALYKYEIRSASSGAVFVKADPYGRHMERRPATASIVAARGRYDWGDADWLERRARTDWQHRPMSIYEVHLGSWERGPEGEFLNYRAVAERLVPYVQELGFSHIELLPVTEHPYDPSWGYQTTGYYAPTSRYGDPDDLRGFVDFCHHHDMLTFSMLYCFTENFLPPFSHDEVVHGKQSMLHKMRGDEWQKFANLRALYTYMFTHPGKKLLFMGTEFGQGLEWNSAQVLDWYVLDYPVHQGVKALVRDLNRLYHATPALHRYEFEWRGFEWIDCHDAEQSVVSFLRRSEGDFVVVVLNFTPVPRRGYRIGVPEAGAYREIFNSDSRFYGGSDLGNGARLRSSPQVLRRMKSKVPFNSTLFAGS